MSIPNRQIGWSQESNLLWEIAREIDQINKIVGAGKPAGTVSTANSSIPNRQIGWSQEENLLYEVLRQVVILRKTIA